MYNKAEVEYLANKENVVTGIVHEHKGENRTIRRSFKKEGKILNNRKKNKRS